MGLSFNQRRSNFVREADSFTRWTLGFSTLCVDAGDLTDVAEASMSQRKRERACVSWSEAMTTVEAEADEQMNSERASNDGSCCCDGSACSFGGTSLRRFARAVTMCGASRMENEEWTVRAKRRKWETPAATRGHLAPKRNISF